MGSNQELLLKVLEPGAALDEDECRTLQDKADVREECRVALDIVSACRRDREHVDVQEALARFHTLHHSVSECSASVIPMAPVRPRHALLRRLSWAAAAIALLVVVFVTARFFRSTTPEPLASVATSHHPILLDVDGTTKPISVESALRPIHLPSLQTAKPSKEIKTMTVSVPAGQSLTLSLPDGSTVSMYPNSTLSYPSVFTGDERRVKLTGKATFQVVHDEAHPFFVDAEAVETKVLGTMFNICTYSGAPIRVTLIEGRIQVCDPYHCIVLNPGEQAAFFQTKDMIISDVDTQTLRGWLKGQLHYHDAPLSTVVEDLCRYYDVTPHDLANLPPSSTKVSLDASCSRSLSEVIDILNKTNQFNISIR